MELSPELRLSLHGMVERAIRESFEATDYELKVIRGELPMPIMPPIRIPVTISGSRQLPVNPKGDSQ
jgi:hypothetical protein